MQRAAVLEEILRTLPPEVSQQVESLSKLDATKVERPKPSLRRSQTSTMVQGNSDAGRTKEMPNAPMDISLQRRCVQLEAQLDKWVGIAQLLSSELAYREKRLWDWQMDHTNTRVVVQKFKDRVKGVKKGGSPVVLGGVRGSPRSSLPAVKAKQTGWVESRKVRV